MDYLVKLSDYRGIYKVELLLVMLPTSQPQPSFAFLITYYVYVNVYREEPCSLSEFKRTIANDGHS